MTKLQTYLAAAAFVLAVGVGSAMLLGVDETLALFQGLAGIAQEAQ